MSVPTGNVFLSFSKGAMDRFLHGKAMSQDEVTAMSWQEKMELYGATDRPHQDDVFTFSNATPEDDSSLQIIEFTHDLVFETGHVMNITLLDPSRKFEERVFSQSVGKDMAAYAVKFVGDMALRKPDPDFSTRLILTTDLQESLKEQPQDVQDKIKENYDKLVKERDEDNSKRIYVTYGVGTNYLSWSGPHLMYMVAAEIVTNKGSRLIKIKLTGVPLGLPGGHRLNSFGSPVALNAAAGLKTMATGFSQRFANVGQPRQDKSGKSFGRGAGGIGASPGVFYGAKDPKEDFLSKSSNASLQRLLSFTDLVDFHLIITDCVKSFVQKATGNPKVIVLLPNLNFVLSQIILSTMMRLGWTSDLITANPAQYASKTMTVVDEVMKAVGLNLQKWPITIKDKLVVPAGQVARFTVPERIVDPAKQNTNSFWVTMHSTDPLMDTQGRGHPEDQPLSSPAARLKSFFSRLNELSVGKFAAMYNLFSESQTDIIDFWTDAEGLDVEESETSKGYMTRNKTFEALRESKDTEVEAIIVGSLGMINQFLYARKELTPKFLSSIKEEFTLNSDRLEWDFPTPMQPPDPDEQKVGAKGSDIISAFSKYPLHSSNSILGDLSYNGKLRQFLIHKQEMASQHFGETQRLPDEFAFSQTDAGQKALDKIKNSGLPVFKYNTSNPNVTKLKADYNPLYWAALGQLGLSPEYTFNSLNTAVGGSFAPVQPTAHSQVKQQAEINLTSRGLGEAEIRELLLNALMESTDNPELQDAFKSSSEIDDIAAMVQAWQLVQGANPLFIPIKTYQSISKRTSAALSFMAFLNSLYNYIKQVTITTLPMPYYSTASFLFHECVLFAQIPNVKQTTELSYSPLDAFLSGIYRMAGFRHTISQRKVESEFKLIKTT